MMPGFSFPPTGPARSGLDRQFTLPTPPPAASPRNRRPSPAHIINKAALPPSSFLVGYSLAHGSGASQKIFGPQKTTVARFAAAPVSGSRPQKGIRRTNITCLTCHREIPILVRSPAAVALERWKRAIYVILTALAFYAFSVLIPWSRLLGSNDTCVGLVIFFVFGGVALYNGVRVIAPEETLLVDIARKPFLDIFPSLTDPGSHTILRPKS